MLPKEIGSRIRISNNYISRRDVEACGFFPEVVTPQYAIMRRDYPDGALEVGFPRRAVVCSSFVVVPITAA